LPNIRKLARGLLGDSPLLGMEEIPDFRLVKPEICRQPNIIPEVTLLEWFGTEINKRHTYTLCYVRYRMQAWCQCKTSKLCVMAFR